MRLIMGLVLLALSIVLGILGLIWGIIRLPFVLVMYACMSPAERADLRERREAGYRD